ncbi:NAD-dependent epimerase/dehydratase family protein [Burkholderiaceae bacterium FT117]|uniref:NAD-dependent epimerase/dehydratase family protein n=1 Tax=Zeimonas sediminis TaxID=2944268 RepID=UPI002342DB84|nr:NAD-dependent epimerase/dehydratase family protein [Zeimonas sediminis]MCM5569100.1 NAD-dependent epimerase/dehydratase family protein [Zeimonas sediminis]
MRVFLTGGTGFIGEALVRAIERRGWTLDALVRRPEAPQARWIASRGGRLVPGDINDAASMREAMREAQLVVHNAGLYEYGADRALRERLQRVNVDGTDTVLGLAHELGVPRALYVSSTVTTGDTGAQPRDESWQRQRPPATAYERSKTEAHRVARRWADRGLPLVIARPNAVVGVNDHSVLGYLLRLYLLGMLLPIGWSPATVFAHVQVDALAEGMLLAAEKGGVGEEYLFSGDPVTNRQMLGFWAAHPGRFLPRLWLPPAVVKPMFAPMEPLLRLAGLPAFLSRETVAVGAMNLNYDSGKARRELGWRHPAPEPMWREIVEGERALLDARRHQGLRARLMPVATRPDDALPADASTGQATAAGQASGRPDQRTLE